MKKKFLLLLAATLASASGWAVEIGTTISWDSYEFRVLTLTEEGDEGTVELISLGHSSGPIEIPGTFDDYDGTTSYTVVSIAENAFKGKDIHQVLSIPKTIKSIGKDAFAGCYATGILKISYEGNISDWCDIDFANGGANPLSLAYRNNVIDGSQSGTQNIIIMNQGCENITFAGELLFEQLPIDGSINHDYKLVIPDDVKVIKPYAFYGIWTGWIEIPASVEAIGESAFAENLLCGHSPFSFSNLSEIVRFEASDNTLVLEGEPFKTSLSRKGQYERETAAVYYGRELQGNSGLDCLASITIGPNMKNFTESYSNLGSLKSVTIEDSEEPLTFKGTGLEATGTDREDQINERVDFYAGRTIIGNVKSAPAVYSYPSLSLTIGGSVTDITPDNFQYFRISDLEFLWGESTLNLQENPFTGLGIPPLTIDRNIRGQFGIEGLKQVTFGENFTILGDYLFNGQTNLTSIVIPDNVTSIGNSTFRNCTGITSLSLGSGLTEIGSYAFAGCTGLTSIDIPDNVTTIGQAAFSGCTALQTATMGESVNAIRNDAFNGCAALEVITMQGNVKTIGNNAFNGCAAIGEIIIPGSVTSIGQNAFSGCENLQTVTFAEGNDDLMLLDAPFSGSPVHNLYIGRNLMSNIKFGLESDLLYLYIGDNVRSIGANAFNGYKILYSVSIGSGLVSSGADAFAGCTGLKEVHINDMANWCEIDFANPNANPSTITRTFYLNEVLVSNIDIPESVTTVKPYAFYNNLAKMVTVNDGVKEIGAEAFYNNTDLDMVIFGRSLYEIGDEAFKGCTSLRELEFNGRLKAIGDNAFNGCSAVTSVTIPASMESIGESAFSGCTSLSTVYISDLAAWCGIDFTNHESNPLHLGGELMLDNEMVTRVDTPEDVTEVKPYAFYGANAIVSVTASEDLKKIGDFAFYGNKMLGTANLSSELVKSIGANAFASCERLTSLSLGCNIGTLGEGAFTGCTALTSVEAYNLTPAQIADFEEAVYQNATLTVPAGYKQEYAEAEGWKEFVNVKEGGEIYKVDISWDKEGGKVIYEGDELEGFNATPYKFIEIYIYPAEGYDVEEVTANGTSKLYSYSETFHSCTIGYITKDTDIIVTFKNNVSGIDEAGAQDVSVRGADGAIIVEGLGQDATVNVYNISGQLVYSGNDSVINTVSGVYVIEISGKVYKTVVR